MVHELRDGGLRVGRRRVARLNKKPALSALRRAIALRRPSAGLIHQRRSILRH